MMRNEAHTRVVIGWVALAATTIGVASLLSCQGNPFTNPEPHQWSERRFGPLVPHDTFPGDCSLCHIPERWDVLREDFHFDHEAETGVPLVGAHEQASCLRCHNDRGPVAEYQARGCSGCHLDPHEATMGLDCESCHDQVTWRAQGIAAEHQRTRFPLYGAHLAVACDLCHPLAKVGVYEGLSVECETCHQEDLSRAVSPDHLSLGWVQDCNRCHQATAWQAATFAHNRFPLTGAHTRADCTDCHQNGVFQGTPSDCLSCHNDDYVTASNPDHLAGNFPSDCQTCHTTSSWRPAFFQHTRFPLTGRHAQIQCSDCHTGNVFTPLPSDCNSCHNDDYLAATNPNHAANNLPLQCQQCHGTTAWVPSTLNHEPRFPIQSGAHSVLSCIDCHNGGNVNTFTCTNCHEHRQSEMDDEHDDVAGYVYSSPACLACHPDGRE